MPPDVSLWQAAGDANNRINSIQPRTNKRFRGWDSSGDRKTEKWVIKTIGEGAAEKRLKREEEKEYAVIFHLYCEGTHTVVELLAKSGIIGPQGWDLRREKTGELASKLPDKSIIPVLGDTSSAGGHRWLRGCQVQHTWRGCQGKLQCRNCSPESLRLKHSGSNRICVRQSCWHHVTPSSQTQTSEVPFVSVTCLCLRLFVKSKWWCHHARWALVSAGAGEQFSLIYYDNVSFS